MATRKALIFGISGQDGALLARLLVGKGYRVHGTSRDAQLSGFANLTRLGVREQVQLHSAATTDFRSVAQVLDEVRPEETYLLAGQSSVGLSFGQPVETLESIALGALNVLEAIRFLKLDTRLYHAGSSECFGDVGQAADEDTAFRPRSPYAVAKASAHWMVANYREAYGLHACTGILFNHESPLRPTRFVTRKIVSAAVRIAAGSGERLQLGDLTIERDWGWAPEYVDAMWRMLQHDRAEDFVIATGRMHSLREFVALAFAAVGLDWQAHVDFDPGLRRPSDIAHSVGDASKAREVLGWTAVTTLEQVIARMVAAERGETWPMVAG
ncbi:MAG: GDP-mannose 4,6-dehydratase [Thermomonas sp.]|uniref:GDP-mannose 4,6-dehydratase n=1 Tax=Thermomonas sp. TaxID=1971895 RepID=UPI002634BADE|nr:GDP-mannose 4,6-dehydratase [Thermomonas sp.]MCC7097559.1 GDP-mannose 4,6-dehydratase [Thermomonas sp.]